MRIYCTLISQSRSFRWPGAKSAPDHQKLLNRPHLVFDTAWLLCIILMRYRSAEYGCTSIRDFTVSTSRYYFKTSILFYSENSLLR